MLYRGATDDKEQRRIEVELYAPPRGQARRGGRKMTAAAARRLAAEVAQEDAVHG